MFTCRGMWKSILFITTWISIASGAPVSCSTALTQMCVDGFLGELLQAIQADTSTNFTEIQICQNSFPKYQTCVSSCNPPFVSKNLLVDGAVFLCSKTENDRNEGIECVVKPQVVLATQLCPRPPVNAQFCAARDAYLACVQTVTSSMCTSLGGTVLREYLLHSYRVESIMYNCDVTTTTATSTTTIITPITEPSTSTPTTEVTTEPTTSESTTAVTTQPTTSETTTKVTTQPTTSEPITTVTTVSTTSELTTEVTTQPTTSESTTEVTTQPTTSESTTEVTTQPTTSESTTEVTTQPTTSESTTQAMTTSTAAATIGCYECHSGYGNYTNRHCPVNGVINRLHYRPIECSDRCFARTNKWNVGVIVRGCAGRHLPVDYPRPLPLSGCKDINGEKWCFCNTTRCNIMSMASFLQNP